jgi:hypothetical protein
MITSMDKKEHSELIIVVIGFIALAYVGWASARFFYAEFWP